MAIKPASELVAEIQGKSPQVDEDDPKAKREWTFHFEGETFEGKTLKGSFTNRCLSTFDQIQVGVVRAQLCGNVPIDALDNQAWKLAERIAHMTLSLVKRPKWAAELGDLMDPLIIEKLYAEVASHEARFRRPQSDPGADQKAPEDADGADGDSAPGEE